LDWTRAEVEEAHLGQSESVRAGLRTVQGHGDFDAVLLTPCDLPLLSVAHLNALLSRYRGGNWDIVASKYDGVLGAPLIVGRALWAEVDGLRGDAGVRKILPSHQQSTSYIEWDGGRFDVDTVDDVTRLQKLTT
jgi:CTP:molybdopterin cytidylyltransferase MocA